MKQNQSLNRLRKSLLAGIASLSLVAVGCGGGSGTVAPSQTTPLFSIFGNKTGATSVAVDVFEVSTSGAKVATSTLSSGTLATLSVATGKTVTNSKDTWYLVRAQDEAGKNQGRVAVFMRGSELQTPLAHTYFNESRVFATYDVLNNGQDFSNFDIHAATDAVPTLSVDKAFLTTLVDISPTSALYETAKSIGKLFGTNATEAYQGTTDPAQPYFDTVVSGIVNGQEVAYTSKDENKAATGPNFSLSGSGARYALAPLPAAEIRDALALATSNLRRLLQGSSNNSGKFNDLVQATISAQSATIQTVSFIGNVVADVVSLDTLENTTNSNGLLDNLLKNVNKDASTLASQKDTLIATLDTDLVNLADNVRDLDRVASSLGSLAGALISQNRDSSAAVKKVVDIAGSGAMNVEAARRLGGSMLAKTLSVGSGVAGAALTRLNEIAAVRFIPFNNFVLDSIRGITSPSVQVGQEAISLPTASFYAKAIETINGRSDLKDSLGGAGFITNLVDQALEFASEIGSNGLQSVLNQAGKTNPELKMDISGQGGTFPTISTARVFTFSNNSIAVNGTGSAAYNWEVIVEPGSTALVGPTSSSARTFTISVAPNAVGTYTVVLKGNYTGLNKEARSEVKITSVNSYTPELSIEAPSVVLKGTTVSLKYSVKDILATTSGTVTISSLPQGTTTQDLLTGNAKFVDITANSVTGPQNVVLTYTVRNVTYSASKTITVTGYPYVLSIAQIGTNGVLTTSNTTASLTISSSLLDSDPAKTASSFGLELRLNSCDGNQVAKSASSSLTVEVTAPNIYAVCANASRGTLSATAQSIFTVKQQGAPSVTGFTVNGSSAVNRTFNLVATNANTVTVPVTATFSAGVVTSASFGANSLTTNTAVTNATNNNVSFNLGSQTMTLRLTGPTGIETLEVYTVNVSRKNSVAISGFTINGQGLTLDTVSGTTLTATTNAVTANSTNLSFGVKLGDAQTSLQGSITVKLRDVNTSDAVVANGGYAEITVSGIKIERDGTGWAASALNNPNFTLSASAVGRGGTPSGSGSVTRTDLGSYITGTAQGITVNLANIRGTLSSLSGLNNLDQITTAQDQRVQVEVVFSLENNEEFTHNTSKVSTILINGLQIN